MFTHPERQPPYEIIENYFDVFDSSSSVVSAVIQTLISRQTLGQRSVQELAM